MVQWVIERVVQPVVQPVHVMLPCPLPAHTAYLAALTPTATQCHAPIHHLSYTSFTTLAHSQSHIIHHHPSFIIFIIHYHQSACVLNGQCACPCPSHVHETLGLHPLPYSNIYPQRLPIHAIYLHCRTTYIHIYIYTYLSIYISLYISIYITVYVLTYNSIYISIHRYGPGQSSISLPPDSNPNSTS